MERPHSFVANLIGNAPHVRARVRRDRHGGSVGALTTQISVTDAGPG